MSWVAIIVDPNDNKVKIDWFYLKKIVLGTVRGDQFLYIILEVHYKYSSYCYNFSLNSLIHFLMAFFLYYTILLLSFLPFTCRVDCWC